MISQPVIDLFQDNDLPWDDELLEALTPKQLNQVPGVLIDKVDCKADKIKAIQAMAKEILKQDEGTTN